MVLKLYGHPLSGGVKLVASILHEKQVAFEFLPVDFLKGENKTPEFLAKNPFGLVPIIDDGGFIVYESRAIARYVAEKYADQGTKLIPTDFKSRILFEQAASVEQNSFHPHASGIAYERLGKPHLKGLAPDEAVVKDKVEKLSASLDVYDQILGKQKYIAGDDITLADLFHLTYGSYLAAAGTDVIEKRPNVARWFQELSSRPSWERVTEGVTSTA